jgi:hypothetical protein
MMRWILTIFIAAMAVVGCQRGADNANDFTASLSVTPDPPRVGAAQVAVSLRDTVGQPVTGAQVELEGTMSHAGMTPVIAAATEDAPGVYRADLEFTMAGDWIIIVRATLTDGRTWQRQIDLPGVQGKAP